MSPTQVVSWKSYAQKYDMLLSFNPFYQHLHQAVLAEVSEWEINGGDLIADVGAGTGNYSLSLARLFPQARVLHIDNDSGMNEAARTKRTQLGISNHAILESGIEDVELAEGSLRALISIHALYTFPRPEQVLQRMHKWLQPGGEAILVDAGRIVNVLSWQLAISFHLLRTYGWKKTWEIFREGREVSQQNAYIRNMQGNGTFWTHSHAEYCTAVEKAGFEILDAGTTFRGISDWVKVRKGR